MALNSFTQGYIHNSKISNDKLLCVLVWAEGAEWSMRKSEKLQGAHIEIDESKRLCSDAHIVHVQMGMCFFTP